MSDLVVTADTFSPAIERILDEALREIDGDLLAAATAAGKAGAEAARAASPRDTGAYAAGWSWEMEPVGGAGRYVRVFNRAKPSLTHLLELGHEEYGFDGEPTGGRVHGTPHIAPAAYVAAAAFLKEASS